MNMNKTNQEEQPHWQAFILLLKEVAKQKGISNYEIADKTGYAESTIGRIFKLEFCPKLQIFLDIMQVLNLNIFFETRDGTTELNLAFENAMEQIGRRPEKLPKN